MASSTLRPRTNLPSSSQHDSNTLDSASAEKPTTPSKAKAHTIGEDEGPTSLTLLDVLRVIAGLILLSSTLSYFITGNSITWGYRPAFTRPVRIKAWLVRSLLFLLRQASC